MTTTTIGKTLAAAVASSILLTGNVLAEESKYYSGISFSALSIEAGDDFYPKAITAKFGTTLNENFSAEARGSFGMTDDDKVELQYHAGLYLRGGFKPYENGFLYAIAGLSYAKVKGCVGTVCERESETGPSFGVGMDFLVRDNARINIEIGRLLDEDDSNIDSLSIGIVKHF